MPRTAARGIAFLSVLAALSGCGDRSSDELAPYYSGEVIADFPAEMAEYRSVFEASGLPFATAAGKVGPTSASDSKFLGRPYMPRGFEYPRDPNGRPLKLLTQINFADVPPLPDFPESGILQFYISDDLDVGGQAWGMQFYVKRPYDAQASFELLKSQDYFRVIWHEHVASDEDALRHNVPAGPEGMMPIDDEAKLTFSPGTSYPPPGDYRFEKIFGAGGYGFFERFGEEAESVFTRYYSHVTVREIAWIGGYADFVQGDPREIVSDEDWLLLLEIQTSTSLDQPSVMWGDAGVGAFLIRPEDLRKRDFSRVLYNWDSH